MTGYKMKPASECHNHYVSAALTDGEYAKLRRLSRETGKTASELIREAIRNMNKERETNEHTENHEQNS